MPVNAVDFKPRWILALLALAVTFAAPCSLSGADRAKTPNIVLIFADDQGYADLGCFGAKGFATPNIDRIAKEGIRFTSFYVAQPVCSASRTALLTGCYPNRLGIHGALNPKSVIGISDQETTLAQLVKSKGYATGMVGKWHLGHLPQFLPTRHGFDSYFGLPYSNDMWPNHPEAPSGFYPPLPLLDGEKVFNAAVGPADQPKLTTQYTERAVKFIDANKDKPFFLYVAHSMPHVPLFVSDKFKGKTERGLYGDVIAEIDWSTGEILKALDRHKIADNTLVMYTSDNGPWLSYGNHGGSAGPLREGKGTVWEGGVREPFVARWPGVIPTGAVCSEPAMTIDVLPTVAKIVGAELPKLPIDGKDIGPLLRNEPGAKCPHEAYYFYYHVNELHAVRSGKWKLMLPHAYRTMDGKLPNQDGTPVKYGQARISRPELYDLDADVGERKNVADANPDVVKKLLVLADRMRGDLGDLLTMRRGEGAREPGRAPMEAK
jgi:arylsulfatase A